VGFFEGLLEAIVEGVVTGGALGFLGTASLGALVLDEGSTGGLAGIGGNNIVGTGGGGEGVELLHHVAVLEGVLLGLVVSTAGGLDSVQFALDLVGVDNAGEVGALHGVALELVASLLLASLGSLGVGAEDLVELVESRCGEDYESSDVATRGELEQVQSGDVARINTGEVAGNAVDVSILGVVNNERSLAHGEARVTVFTGTIAHFLGSADAGKVLLTSELVESLKETGGGLGVEGVRYKREFGNLVNTVATGEHERSAGGGGEGRGDGVALLVRVDLAVPFAPDLEGSEHATLAALVTESGLAGTVGTGARNTGNSSDGATSSPRLGGVLVSLEVEHTVGLPSVLGHVGVDEGDDIVTDGRGEDSGHLDIGGDLGDGVVAVEGVDGAAGAGHS